MKMTVSILMAVFLSTIMGYAQLPKGDRTLAWQIDMAENNNYDSAFAYGYNACLESVHLSMRWTDIEPDTGAFNSAFINNFLEVVDIYYPAWDVKVELQIAPTNTGIKEVPGELMNLPFNHPEVINRFKIMLDTVFAYIPNVTLSALNIGNESDLNFGTNEAQYNEFKTFLDSVAAHAKDLYFNLHGTELRIGTTFTHHGLVHNATAGLCQSVNAGLDIVAVTYYPLNGDFTMQDPGVVSSDFAELVTAYPDTTQPIYFAECGYASSTLCNSSETLQAEFWTQVFDAWDTYQDNIKYITVFKSTDWSVETVNQLSEYYNLQDTVFKEYLRTLGVRSWEGDGTNKGAYDRILCELDGRDWCTVSCLETSVSNYTNDPRVTIFPNPASHSVNIRFEKQPGSPYIFRLYNSMGQIIWTINGIQDAFLLERQALSSGVYFYQLSIENQADERGKLVFE